MVNVEKPLIMGSLKIPGHIIYIIPAVKCLLAGKNLNENRN